MFARDSRRTRRSVHDRSRPSLAAVERLEARELLAYNPLGFTLPDVVVKGFASSVAAWGGTLTITADISNNGASTIPEPFAQTPNPASTSDNPATFIAVLGSVSKHANPHEVLLGTIPVPSIPQNTTIALTQTIPMPAKPAGFPGDGGTIYVSMVVNPGGATNLESDIVNNASQPVPVLIEAPFPELVALSLDVPPVMQPGDTIAPNIRIANLGTTDTDLQGPVTVLLVASTTPNVNSGSTIVAQFTIDNVPALSNTATGTAVFGDQNLNPQDNIVTIIGAPVTLPVAPGKYYIGVVVDPFNQIKQIGKIPQFNEPKNSFTVPHVVQTVPGLPPAGVITAGGSALVPIFPFPLNNLPVGGSADGTTFPAQLNANLAPTALLSAAATGGITSTSGIAGTGASPAQILSSRRAALNVLFPTRAPQTGFPGLNPGAGRSLLSSVQAALGNVGKGKSSSSTPIVTKKV